MTATTLTRRTVGTVTVEHVDFDVRDQRGRAIGAAVTTFMVTFTALPDGATSGWCHAPGTFFGLCVQATRNGRGYGASQPWRFFATAAERARALAASLTASRRRASAKAVAC